MIIGVYSSITISTEFRKNLLRKLSIKYFANDTARGIKMKQIWYGSPCCLKNLASEGRTGIIMHHYMLCTKLSTEDSERRDHFYPMLFNFSGALGQPERNASMFKESEAKEIRYICRNMYQHVLRIEVEKSLEIRLCKQAKF